jgi:hypothetical protein
MYEDESGEISIVEDEVERMFEITPDRIRGAYEIQITTKYNQPSLISEKRQALNEGMNNLKQIAEIAQIMPEMQAYKTEFIKEVMTQYDIPVDIDPESKNNTIKAEANKVLEQANSMANASLGTSLA